MNYKEKIINFIRHQKIPTPIDYLIYRSYTLYYSLFNLIKYHDPYRFRNVAIEISTFCNRHCLYCPNNKYQTPKRLMTLKLFKLAISRLKEIEFSSSLYFHFYNEPLLDKRLPTLVKLAKISLPNCLIRIFTNGDYLDKAYAERLIKAGVFEFVITNHQPDTNQWHKKIIELKTLFPTYINIQSLSSTQLSNRGGLVKVSNTNSKNSCVEPLQTLQIDIDGNVILCCNDYFRKYKFGNIKNSAISDIWNSLNFKTLRTNLRKGIITSPICQKCLNTYD